MGRFIDCQCALTTWGAKAKYRRAKVGLLRKEKTVYIAIFSNNQSCKRYPIDPRTIEVLPAAIRFKDMEVDLFIRQASDEQRYATLLREIKVILKRDKLNHNGKSETYDKFLSTIPSLNSIDARDLKPSQVSAYFVCNTDRVNSEQELSTSVANSAQDDHQLNRPDIQLGLNSLTDVHYLNAISNNRRKLLQNKDLRRVKISGLDILPKELWFRSSLHELTLTNCNLTCVPKQMETFSKTLSFLDLSNNRITSLPRSFCCKMNNLVTLDLSHNLIQLLPIEIKFFSRLDYLNLSNNLLRMLPSTFSDLRSLTHLNVANNNLSQLPAFRKDEVRLRHLDVSFNPLDGASREANTFEVHPSFDDGSSLAYNENLYCPMNCSITKQNKIPNLFEIALLRIVRCDRLLKLASEESLPRTIISTMQREIFKCSKCNRLNILPAYNSTDILDYVDHVENLQSTGSFRHGMTFMKLLCRSCFDSMSS